MKLSGILKILLLTLSFNSYAQAEKISGIIDYVNRNQLTIYRDGSVLSNTRVMNQYINELVQRMGRSNNIEFIVRTKKNGLYRTTFEIRDSGNNTSGKLRGSIVPITDRSSASSTMYPIESLDTMTLVFRFKEKEDLMLNDYILLLNSMLYKDETLTNMINVKVNDKNQTSEDKQRLTSMTRDLLENKRDIIAVSTTIIDFYNKENSQIERKANKTADDLNILNENKSYIEVYNVLIGNMRAAF